MCRLPKLLGEEAARLHLEEIGVVLTKLTKAEADCLGVSLQRRSVTDSAAITKANYKTFFFAYLAPGCGF